MYPRFLPKSKAIGLRKISIFTVNFSPLKAFSLVLQWFTKCFISAQKVTWIILIGKFRGKMYPKIFTKIQGYRLTKNLNFHGQLLSSQSIQFWSCNDLQNVHLCPKGDVNHINWKFRGKLCQRIFTKMQGFRLTKNLNFSPLKAFSLALQWFTKCSSLPKEQCVSYKLKI